MMDNRNAITTTSNISISNNSNNSNNTTNTNTTSTTKSFSSSSSSSCSSCSSTTTTACTNDNNITSDSNRNDHASDTFYFHSTQMQSIHETVVEQETIRERQKQSLSALRSLSYLEAENDKPANNLIIKSTSHRKQGIRNLTTPHTTTTRASNRRASTEPKMKKKGKNQSMSKLVRENYSVNGHINNYGVSNPDQSRIDQFCARLATDTLTIYMQRNRLHCDAPNEKVLISREEWYQALKSVKLQFPSKVIHVKAKRDSLDTPKLRIELEQEIEIKEEEEEVEEYDKGCFENIDTKSLWDKAMIHRPLSHNEIKWLYNEGM